LALERRPDVAVGKRHLSQIHELVDAIDRDLGELARRYATDKNHLADHLHLAVRNTGALLNYVQRHLPDPRTGGPDSEVAE
jgi:hypothetical protein